MLLLVLLAAAAMAQTTAGSISGVVRDSFSGAPVSGARVAAWDGGKSVGSATTDFEGRFRLAGMAPGAFRITVLMEATSTIAQRTVVLNGAQDLTGIDFRVVRAGTVSGTVTDENKKPVSGVMVCLVAREWEDGTLRYVFAGLAQTKEHGDYVVQGVDPGIGYLVLARPPSAKFEAVSNAPADPALRPPVVSPTYYFATTDIESAQVVTIRSGESREHIDIQMMPSPSYCIEGRLQSQGEPRPLRFEIAETRPSNGSSGSGMRTIVLSAPSAVAGPDGRIRLCGLARGEYRLTAYSAEPRGDQPGTSGGVLGSATVAIANQDVGNLVVDAMPHVTVPGAVVWEGATSQSPAPPAVNVSATAIGHTWFAGQRGVTGPFSLSEVHLTEYSLSVTGLPAGAYLKDIWYGGRSILHEPLRLTGPPAPEGLRIVLARDGGTVSARVNDSDGNAVAGTPVVVAPADAVSEGIFAASMVAGVTDSNGVWRSGTLAPGSYRVMAVPGPVNRSLETVARLWAERSRASEVEIAAGGSAQVNLAPLE